MAKIDLSKYGIKGTTEVLYNPTYEVLYNEETRPELEGQIHRNGQELQGHRMVEHPGVPQ